MLPKGALSPYFILGVSVLMNPVIFQCLARIFLFKGTQPIFIEFSRLESDHKSTIFEHCNRTNYINGTKCLAAYMNNLAKLGRGEAL